MNFFDLAGLSAERPIRTGFKTPQKTAKLPETLLNRAFRVYIAPKRQCSIETKCTNEVPKRSAQTK